MSEEKKTTNRETTWTIEIGWAWMWIMIAIITALLLWGCGGQNDPLPTTERVPTRDWVVGGSKVVRFHDDEQHVTCWVIDEYNRSAITCLPDAALQGGK